MPHPHRSNSARFSRAIALWAALSTPAPAIQPDLEPESAPIAPANALFNPDAAQEGRTAAALSLIHAGSDTAIDLITQALQSDTPPGSRRAALSAIESLNTPPESLVQPLATLTASLPIDELPTALRAIARYSSREAVEPVVNRLLTDPPPPPETITALVRTLRVQTGRIDLPEDPVAWSDWWTRTRFLPANQWQAALLRAQGIAIRQISEDLSRANTRLTDAYTRLHLLTPIPQRAQLIVELLADPAEPLRNLGLELAERALLNAEPVGPTVAEALASLLTDDSPRVRAKAASILDRVGLPESTPRLTDALALEPDPTVAIPLLRAAARRAATAAAPDVIRWTESDSPARPAAIQALADLLAAGYTPTPDTRDRAIAALTPTLTHPEPPARAWEALARLGSADQLLTMLHSGPIDRAQGAAAALVPLETHARSITDAALQRPPLAPAALSAIRLHNATAEGFRLIQAFLPEDPEARTEALTQFIRAMPPRERAAAAARSSDPETALKLLTFASNPENLADLPNAQAIVESRADLLLRAGRYEELLQSIQALPESIDRAALLPFRTRALLRLNRAEEAAAAGADPALIPLWLEELAAHPDPRLREPIAAQMRTLFGAAFTIDQRARLDTLSPPPNSGQDESASEQPDEPQSLAAPNDPD